MDLQRRRWVSSAPTLLRFTLTTVPSLLRMSWEVLAMASRLPCLSSTMADLVWVLLCLVPCVQLSTRPLILPHSVISLVPGMYFSYLLKYPL